MKKNNRILAITKSLHFGVVVVPAALLFRLCFFSFVPGEMGLFSAPLPLFFNGEGTTDALTSGEVASFGGAGALVCG